MNNSSNLTKFNMPSDRILKKFEKINDKKKLVKGLVTSHAQKNNNEKLVANRLSSPSLPQSVDYCEVPYPPLYDKEENTNTLSNPINEDGVDFFEKENTSKPENYNYEIVFYKDNNILFRNKTIEQFKFPKDFSYFDIYNYSDISKALKVSDKEQKVKNVNSIRNSSSPLSKTKSRISNSNNLSNDKELEINHSSPWQYIKSWPEYMQMNNGDVILTIEYCCECGSHNWMTSHNEGFYLKVAEKVKETVELLCSTFQIKLISILKPIDSVMDKHPTKVYKSGMSRLGACEVQLTIKKNNLFLCHLIHSKLITSNWPDLDQIDYISRLIFQGSGLDINNSNSILSTNIADHILPLISTSITMVEDVIDINGYLRFLPTKKTVISYSFIQTGKDQFRENVKVSNLMDITQTIPSSPTPEIEEPSLIWENPPNLEYGILLSDEQLNASCNLTYLDGKYYYYPTIGAKLMVGTHNLRVEYVYKKKDRHFTLSKCVKIVVEPNNIPNIIWSNPRDIEYGTSLSTRELNAELDLTNSLKFKGRLVYKPNFGEVLDVGVHCLTVEFIKNGNLNSLCKKSVKIKVTSPQSKDPEIIWNDPSEIEFGTSLSKLQLNAQCDSKNIIGNFSYSPDFGIKLPIGKHILKVNFTYYKYNNLFNNEADLVSIEKCVVLNVIKKTPIISWTPAKNKIFIDTPLDIHYLNATCFSKDIDGLFHYYPSFGERLLTLGSCLLEAFFIPNDLSSYLGAKKSISIDVVCSPTIIWDNPDSIFYGDILTENQLNASVSGEIEGDFIYDPSIGAKLNPGIHMIKLLFIPSDKSKYVETSLETSIVVNKYSPNITWDKPVDIYFGTELSFVQLNASLDEGIDGIFEYNPSFGKLLNAGEHVLKVSFLPFDKYLYDLSENTINLTVVPCVCNIEWDEPADLVYGDRLDKSHLNAKCLNPILEGRYFYSPSVGEVLSAGIHTLSVIFTPDSDFNFASTEKTVSIYVQKFIPTLKWDLIESIDYGTVLSDRHLNALCVDPLVTGYFFYTPQKGNRLNPGKHELKVSFRPENTESMEVVEIKNTIEVRKLCPIIKWNNPPSIEYGESLSSIQLNAIIDSQEKISGMFKYDPSFDSILPVGDNIIQVHFFPHDSDLFMEAQKSVTIRIKPLISDLHWENPSPIPYGIALTEDQLNAICIGTYLNIPGEYIYEPSLGEVLKTGMQELNVTFFPFDQTFHAPLNKSVSLIVEKLDTIALLQWDNPVSICFGEELSSNQLNAYCKNSDIRGLYTYDPDFLTILDVGIHPLKVLFTPFENDKYNNSTKTVSLVVTPKESTISWRKPSEIIYGTILTELQLCAHCDVKSLTGKFFYSPSFGELLTAGTHKLTVLFSPENDINYGPAELSVVLSIQKKTPIIIWDALYSIDYGTVISDNQLCANAVIFSDEIEQINSNKSLDGDYYYDPVDIGSLLKPGIHDLEVLFVPSDNDNFNEVKKTNSIVVHKKRPTLKWDIPAAIEYEDLLLNLQLNAICLETEILGEFLYIPPEGTKLDLGTHELEARFIPFDCDLYLDAVCRVEIEVTYPVPKLIWNEPLLPLSYGMALSYDELSAKCIFSNHVLSGKYVYSPPVGVILNPGNHFISVIFYPDDSLQYKEITGSIDLQVNKAIPKIIWDIPSNITLGTPLSSTQLNAYCEDQSILGDFQYHPSIDAQLPNAGENILTVDFYPKRSDLYERVTRTININVVAASCRIVWASPLDITFGTKLSGLQLRAKCANSQITGKFEYSPSFGEILPVGDHVLMVTFTPDNINDFTTTETSTKICVRKVSPTILWEAIRSIEYGTAISDVQFNAICLSDFPQRNDQDSGDLLLEGEYIYEPSVGTIFTPGIYKLKVVFIPKDNQNINLVEKRNSIVVHKKIPSINWHCPLTIEYGEILTETHLNAFCLDNIEGVFVYSPKAGELLNPGNQELKVQFIPTHANLFASVTKQIVLTVKKAMPELLWDFNSIIYYGELLSEKHFNARILKLDITGSFNYLPAIGTKLNAGYHTLSVMFSPDNSLIYSNAETSINIFVEKTTPEILWDDPETICYGTPLSSVQLNAFCSIEYIIGSFFYEPNLGEVLIPGSHKLKVIFQPSDLSYNVCEKNVVIIVTKQKPLIDWNNPHDIIYGEVISKKHLNASCSDKTISGSYFYEPDEGHLFTPGIHPLSVTFQPDNTQLYRVAHSIVSITVKQYRLELTWEKPDKIIYGTVLGNEQLNANCNNKEVSGVYFYSPSSGDILNVGTHKLEVTFVPDNSDYATTEYSVNITVIKYTPKIVWRTSNIIYGTPLGENQLCAEVIEDNIPGKFSYSPDTGTILETGKHAIEVIFIPNSSANYRLVNLSVDIEVSKYTPILRWESKQYDIITVGQPLSSLNVNAYCQDNIPGYFKIFPEKGTVLPIGSHNIICLFIPHDSKNYNQSEILKDVKVLNVQPQLVWNQPNDIEYGELLSELQLNASILSDYKGTLMYNPPLGEKLEIGTHTLSVIFLPFDESSSEMFISKSVTITVTKILPVIIWNPPKDLTHPVKLGEIELCAKCSNPKISGRFVYKPPMGTVLKVGKQVLTVKFIPDNQIYFSDNKMSVKVNVTINSMSPIKKKV